MSFQERQSKQDAFLALLGEGWTSLHLDARRPGVIVPAHLRGEAHLVLQYGHDLPIPIPDLEVDEYGVRATLSFQKLPHLTVVPWSAVYVVTCDDGRGVLYHEDVPDDVSIVAQSPQSPQSPNDRLLADAELSAQELLEANRHGAARERLLRSVPADATAASLPQAAMLSSQPARRRRRPQLRLVK
jgi:stringent starvation protein B